ncbi:hypothetical protein M0R45_035260 [Rubus argutus]|uniref:Retrovirus-related Pol polyprotein from transposon TNT 1-94 n=1 Tax=Rubus argutus TaxID=59490 RepID=A0AAW1VVI3_RUBAR
MAIENNYVQPSIPRFDGHYDHWSMLMENFLRSKEYWSLIETDFSEPATAEVMMAAQRKMFGFVSIQFSLSLVFAGSCYLFDFLEPKLFLVSSLVYHVDRSIYCVSSNYSS